MPTVEESIYIPKPPEEVFKFIVDPASPTQWDATAIDFHLDDDGPMKAGSRTSGTSRVLGRRIDWKAEITEFETSRRVVSRTVEGPMGFTLTLTTQPEGDGTRFTSHVEAETGLGGIFGKITDPLVQKAYARTTRANLETLLEILTEHPQHETTL
ncbi:SRPBCC family protein [Paenarthrobacter sp. NPDC089675]|uniref:SRPBCC family protein n=1 Tax=Paenarthrobacter sp. NPDC089675 TaxID=3364376 RepID=UPI0037F24623